MIAVAAVAAGWALLVALLGRDLPKDCACPRTLAAAEAVRWSASTWTPDDAEADEGGVGSEITLVFEGGAPFEDHARIVEAAEALSLDVTTDPDPSSSGYRTTRIETPPNAPLFYEARVTAWTEESPLGAERMMIELGMPTPDALGAEVLREFAAELNS